MERKIIKLSGNMKEVPLHQENEIITTRKDQYDETFTLEYDGKTYYIYNENRREHWSGTSKEKALQVFWNIE